MESKKTSANRLGHLDLAAGILILWVITFHALNNAKVYGDGDPRVILPYLTFSMPWFFYKSGIFFHPGRGKNGLMKDIHRLLLPFLKWTIIGYAVYLVEMVIDGTFDFENCIKVPFVDKLWIFGYVPIDVPLWFLLSLFIVRVLSALLQKVHMHPLIVVALGVGIAFGHHMLDNPDIPVWVSNIPLGLAFFYPAAHIHKYEEKMWLFVPCLILYVFFLITDTPVVGMHRNVYLGGNYYLWPLFGICGIITFNNICKWICKAVDHVASFKYRPLTIIGKHSLWILVTHAFIYMPAIHYSTLSPILTFVIIEVCYFAIIVPIVLIRDYRQTKALQ